MKKLLSTLVLTLAMMVGTSAHSGQNNQLEKISLNLIKQSLQSVDPLYLLDWKVGDTANFVVHLGMFGDGSMKKHVTKFEGDTLWMRQDVDMIIQKQVCDVQIDRNNAQVLKMICNGQEQSLPDGEIEIISQDYETITVPAGTFKSIHIVAKSKDIKKMELWANPQETPMEGTLKMIMSTDFMDITMELTSFSRGQ